MGRLRVYEYRPGLYRAVYFASLSDPGAKEDTSPVVKEGERFESSIARSKSRLKALGLCNEWDYWCTFTFAPDVVDRYNYVAVKRLLTKWFNNMRTRYALALRYVVVPEMHEDGAFHFHGFMVGIDGLLSVPDLVLSGDGSMVPNTKGYYRLDRYPYGFFNCSKIKDNDRAVKYATKYLSKDMGAFPTGSQLVLASKGLRKPVVLRDIKVEQLPFQPTWGNDFISEGWFSTPSLADHL